MPKKIARPKEKKKAQKKVTRCSRSDKLKNVKDAEKVRQFIDSRRN